MINLIYSLVTPEFIGLFDYRTKIYKVPRLLYREYLLRHGHSVTIKKKQKHI